LISLYYLLKKLRLTGQRMSAHGAYMTVKLSQDARLHSMTCAWLVFYLFKNAKYDR